MRGEVEGGWLQQSSCCVIPCLFLGLDQAWMGTPSLAFGGAW